MSINRSDTRVYEPQIQAHLGTTTYYVKWLFLNCAPPSPGGAPPEYRAQESPPDLVPGPSSSSSVFCFDSMTCGRAKNEERSKVNTKGVKLTFERLQKRTMRWRRRCVASDYR